MSQPDLAPGRAQDLLPHVVLVDDELAGAHVASIIRELLRWVPGTAIVALISAEAMGQAQEAVLAGARGFVTKPLQAEELVATLRQVLGEQRARPEEQEIDQGAPGRVIVFCAPKGGTGRTTLAINTALSLRMATNETGGPGGRRLCRTGPRRGPEPAVWAGCDRSAAQALTAGRGSDLGRHGQPRHGTAGPAGAAAGRPVGPHLAAPGAAHPGVLKRMFPWVVVDLGLPLDEMAFAFLDSADRIVVTVLPEMVGLRNTRLMLDRLRERGYAEDRVYLVLNRATMRGGVSRGDIEERLRVQVTHQIPDDQPLATQSINRGVPLVVSHKRGAVVRAIHQLAQQLVEDLTVEGAEEAGNGLLRRWIPSPRSASS